MKLLVLGVMTAAAFIFTTGCIEISAKPVAWEYRVVEHYESHYLEKGLNEAGREGFVIESITVMPADPGATSHDTMIILKRPKR